MIVWFKVRWLVVGCETGAIFFLFDLPPSSPSSSSSSEDGRGGGVCKKKERERKKREITLLRYVIGI